MSSLFENPIDTQKFITLCETPSLEGVDVKAFYLDLMAKKATFTARLNDAFRFMTTWDYARPEVLNTSAVKSVLRRHNYTDITHLVVPTPVGFTGFMYDYISHLTDTVFPVFYYMEKKLLAATSKAVGYYLAYPDDLAALRSVTSVDNAFTQASLTQLKDKEAVFLIAGNRRTDAAFEDVYRSNSDCVLSMTLLNHLNTTRWKNANPTQVAKAVTALTQSTEALFNIIEEHGVEANPKVMTQLTAQLSLVAQWVSFFSIMQARVIDTTTALKHTEKTLLRAL